MVAASPQFHCGPEQALLQGKLAGLADGSLSFHSSHQDHHEPALVSRRAVAPDALVAEGSAKKVQEPHEIMAVPPGLPAEFARSIQQTQSLLTQYHCLVVVREVRPHALSHARQLAIFTLPVASEQPLLRVEEGKYVHQRQVNQTQRATFVGLDGSLWRHGCLSWQRLFYIGVRRRDLPGRTPSILVCSRPLYDRAGTLPELH